MKKVILCSALSILLMNMMLRASVDADVNIVVAGTTHPLSVTIPSDYDPLVSYPLIVGLHYCGGNGDMYRDSLRPLCDSLNVIIACPDNNTATAQMTNPDFVLATIDTIKNNYTIDTTEIFLTGMSCNGFETLKQGLSSVYPFKGIFPWVPYFSSFNSTTFNLDSEVPVVIAVGTVDGNFNAILKLYDSLETHGATVDLVMVKNIGHELAFNGFSNEMTRCMWYLNDTNAITIEPVADFTMYDTDAPREIKVAVANLADRALNFRIVSGAYGTIPVPSVSVNETNDTATFMITPVEGKTGKVYLVLEGTEEGGNGIEQVVFRVTVMAIPEITQELQSEEALKVYPVPASGQLFMNCPEEIVSLQVLNLEGQTIINSDNFNTSSGLDISTLTSGIYFLNIKNTSFKGTARFVVE